MNITLTNNIYFNKYRNINNTTKPNSNLYINNQNLINKDTFEKNRMLIINRIYHLPV